MERTLNKAWERFEDQLRQREYEKKKLEHHFYSDIENDLREREQKVLKKIKNQQDTKEYLTKQ